MKILLSFSGDFDHFKHLKLKENNTLPMVTGRKFCPHQVDAQVKLKVRKWYK